MVYKKCKKEELINVITHGLGAVLSVVALILLVTYSAINGKVVHIISSVVFGVSLILLYAASTIFHAMKSLKWRRIFQKIDHLCIYLLIAGTYTPIALIGLKGIWGWTIFGIIWALVLIGFIFKFSPLNKSDKLSLSLYALMGWLIIVAIKPLVANLSAGALFCILAGGLFYTFGIYFYANRKIPYNHAIWHLFVLGGSTMHFFAVFLYLIP